MNTRLLSLLTLIETAVCGQSNAVVQGSRCVNFEKGLARLIVPSIEDISPGGTFHVQYFNLANGEPSMRVTMSWAGNEETLTVAIFPRDDCNWELEASKLASTWLNGPPPQAAHATIGDFSRNATAVAG